MELYTLDSRYRRQQVIDRFESLIWTDRYAEIGDFELLTVSNAENKQKLAVSTPLALNTTLRNMIVESTEDVTDSEGRKLLKIKGRSFERMLEERLVLGMTRGIRLGTHAVYEGPPLQMAEQIFKRSADPAVAGFWAIHDYKPGTLFPHEPAQSSDGYVRREQKRAPLYTAVKEVCDQYDQGFRLYRNGDTGDLFFNVYTGVNRTSYQSQYPAVIFSPTLENLQNVSEYVNVKGLRNYVQVWNALGVVTLASPGYADSLPPYERRMMIVEADVVENDDGTQMTSAQNQAYLQQIAQQTLLEQRAEMHLDGELSQHGAYRYGVDYFLGDLVEMQNISGARNIMTVTEQIFVQDGEGERSYPTLRLKSYTNPGSWESMGAADWASQDAAAYWSNQA